MNPPKPRTIAQDPYKYGYEATLKLFELCSEELAVPIVGSGTVNVKAEAIRQDNLSAFREKLQSHIEKTSS